MNLAVVEAAQRGIDFTAQSPAQAHCAEDDVLPEAGAAPAEPAAPVDIATVRAELSELADAAMKGRLSPSDEDRATAHMGACIGAGEAAAALAAMPKLPWILGVRAIEQSWPRIGTEAREQLLAGLAQLEGDHAIRLRLSVARSLAKIDPPVGAPLAGSVCRAMWDAEKGALSAEHSKLIGNVFLGRGKPWVLQLALDGLADEDADAVASCVIFSAFNVNNPPITQLSVLRYAGARLGRLHENLLSLVAKGIGRWSGKWQGSLNREIPELPPTLAAALRSERGDAPPAAENGEPAPQAAADDDGEIPLPPDLEEKLKLAIESGDQENIEAVTQEANTWRASQRPAPGSPDAADEENEDNDRRGRRGRRGRGENRPEERAERRSEDRGERRGEDRGDRRGDRKERPAYVSREQEATRGQGVFNLGNALKQIESHVQQLRNELAATQAKLRKGDGPRRGERSSGDDANFSPEELRRLVAQLESRNAELQSRVEELLADSEQRALALASDGDPNAQFRTLLKLKLQDDYNDYRALEANSPDLVVQQHYRTLIRSVFSTLIAEAVALEGALPPPAPAPQPPPPPPPVVDDEEPEDDDLPPELDEIPEDDEPAAGDDAPEDEEPSDEQPEEGALDEETDEPRDER